MLTAVCVTVSEPKKVAQATITLHGRTMICSLWVLRRPKSARILQRGTGGIRRANRQLKLLKFLCCSLSFESILRVGNAGPGNIGAQLKHGLVASLVGGFEEAMVGIAACHESASMICGDLAAFNSTNTISRCMVGAKSMPIVREGYWTVQNAAANPIDYDHMDLRCTGVNNDNFLSAKKTYIACPRCPTPASTYCSNVPIPAGRRVGCVRCVLASHR